MLNRILIYIFLNSFFFSISHANFDIKARTAILQDYYSGEILYEKEPDRSIYPAGLCAYYYCTVLGTIILVFF